MLDATNNIDHSVDMRFTKWDYLAFPFLAALLMGATYGAFRLVGFFGLGILGLIIAFIAVQVDLERDGGHGGHPNVLAEQFKARDRMSRAEKAAFREEQQWRLRPLFAAQIVATGFIIIGFGLHFLL